MALACSVHGHTVSCEREEMMRFLVGLMCGCALVVFSISGCSETADGEAGGSAWAISAGGTSNDQGRGVAALADGSFVLTGSFEETATFGAGGPNETELVSDGARDVFAARYDSDGSLAWAKRAGGVGSELGMAIASFTDGSSVVSGGFEQTATFGPDEAGETALISDGSSDVFVARYNSDGTLAWAKRAGGVGYDTSRGIASFSDGSSVVAGSFDSTATFGAGGANETELMSDGLSDVFLARYDAAGSLLWAKRAGGTSAEIANDTESFADGSFIVTGGFEGTASFGPGEARETELTSSGSRDIFVARYNADGTLAWAKSAGGLESDQPWGVSTFSDGSCVVAGSFLGVATFGPGETNMTSLTSPGGYDLFVARYNSDGTLAWAKRAGGESSAVGRDIASVADDSCVVTGRFEGTATFGPGETEETLLTSAGGSNMFVAHYAGSGELQSATRASSPGAVVGDGAARLTDGSIIITGLFTETATFHEGSADETQLTSNGLRDISIARYKVR